MQTRLNYRPHPKDGEGNVFNLSTPRGNGGKLGGQPGRGSAKVVSQGVGGGQLEGWGSARGVSQRGVSRGEGSAGEVSWGGQLGGGWGSA